MQKIAEKLARYQPETDSRDYIPFSATYRMMAPVMLGHPYIHGDGLVMRQILRQILGDDFYVLPAKTPIRIENYLRHIPLKSSFQEHMTDPGIYHASVSQFDIDQFYVETIFKRFETQQLQYLKTKKKKIARGSGFFRDFMIRIPYLPAKEVKFYFFGGKEELGDLLKNVTHLGKKTAEGFGAVRSCEIKESKEDYSLVKDGIAMRPLPEKIARRFGIPMKIMQLAYRPPYWDKRNIALCAAPGSQFYADAPRAA
jgi:hypothetical protein